ncbi:MFS transporter, partial [Streptomyces sp. NPDC004457]
IASGANNALREVGGALGIAVMSSIFSARGDGPAPGPARRPGRGCRCASGRSRWPRSSRRAGGPRPRSSPPGAGPRRPAGSPRRRARAARCPRPAP